MKPKSEIPWDNYIMQKFGRGIFNELTRIGQEQASDMLLYKALGNLRHGAQRAAAAVWVSGQVGEC